MVKSNIYERKRSKSSKKSVNNKSSRYQSPRAIKYGEYMKKVAKLQW